MAKVPTGARSNQGTAQRVNSPFCRWLAFGQAPRAQAPWLGKEPGRFLCCLMPFEASANAGGCFTSVNPLSGWRRGSGGTIRASSPGGSPRFAGFGFIRCSRLAQASGVFPCPQVGRLPGGAPGGEGGGSVAPLLDLPPGRGSPPLASPH